MTPLAHLAAAAVGLAAVAGTHAQPPAPARAVWLNANIHTADPARPRAAAIAFEVGGAGRILAVGSEDEARRAAGDNADVLDLQGRTVLPGLIDAHGHVASLGAFGLGSLDLSRTASEADLVAAAAAAASARQHGEWLLGGRWDHENWPGRALPTNSALSAATPNNPVWLRRVDGHAGLANAAALALAGVTRDTPNPVGGEIIHDADGSPTGVLIDNAMDLVNRVIPASARAEPGALVEKAQAMCLAVGLTCVHDAGVSPADVGAYRRLESEGRLRLRIYAMVSGPYAVRYFEENAPLVPSDSGRLTVRAAKLYIDGAMGSRGAWLLEPYADRPLGPHGDPYTGLGVSQPEFIENVARHALERGYQVCTHAIGDRGNREVLDAYERALGAVPAGARPDHRFRIEHAQLLAPRDIPRFARLGVIPSMQPTHATSDMRWAEARVGPERVKGAYAWASLLRAGARIAGGSDFPVESHNPFLGFYAAVTRRDAGGDPAGGWQPQERLTREETLRAFTIDAAYAAFQEHALGSLAPGKQADLIVIDRDVMTCPEPDIPATRVLRAVIAGRTEYTAGP